MNRILSIGSKGLNFSVINNSFVDNFLIVYFNINNSQAILLQKKGVYVNMMVYGNTRTRLVGILRDIQKQRALIEFPKYNKEIVVPRLFIHSKLREDKNAQQEVEIETWFLKKNRVLPLYD